MQFCFSSSIFSWKWQKNERVFFLEDAEIREEIYADKLEEKNKIYIYMNCVRFHFTRMKKNQTLP